MILKIQWFGNNILEVSAFIGLDASRILVSGKLFIYTSKGLRGPVPIGSFIIKNNDGTFDIQD